MTVWFLWFFLWPLDATAPVIQVPNIASEQECHRLGSLLAHRGSNSDLIEIHCVAYEAAK
jgi:hypothetical protein